MDDFGRWLKLERDSLGLSQQQVAELVGCGKATVCRIEAGRIRPPGPLQRRIIDALAAHYPDLDEVRLTLLGLTPVERKLAARLAARWARDTHTRSRLLLAMVDLLEG